MLAIVLIITSGLSVVADRDGSHTVSRIRLILSTTAAVDFTTLSDVLLHASAVALPPIHPLILAHYYPWYTLDRWRDARMADQPLRLYSTDETRDVARLVQQAVSAEDFVPSAQF